MDFLFEQFAFKLRNIGTEPKRFLYETIDWNHNPVIIKGPRGTGKTSLILQYVKETFKIDQQVLYVNAGHIYFSQNTLFNLAEKFVKKGGKLLIIDDVHKYSGWQNETEKVLNKFDKLQLVLAGHALDDYNEKSLNAPNAGIYNLPGLSLREFMAFSGEKPTQPVSLQDILKKHNQLASEITAYCDPKAYLPAYLRYGYYPFFLKDRSNFFEILSGKIIEFLESDLTAVKKVDFKNLSKIRQLLWYFAEKRDRRLNITELSEGIGATRGTLLQYLDYLHTGGLLNMLKKRGREDSVMAKPDEVLLDNPNIAAVLQTHGQSSRILEKTLLINQLSVETKVYFSDDADCESSGTKFDIITENDIYQTKFDNITRIYAVNSLEIGINNQIPLWLFGFMY